MNIEGLDIEWLGHSGVRINSIFIDPYQIKTNEKADLILITHAHYDHCSVEDIQKILKPETICIGPPDCTSVFLRMKDLNFKIITPGKKFTSNNSIIESIPAYNLIKPYHPKENEWVGYILTINGKRIYHAGDTDLIPEMNNLNVDIAFLPIGGKFTMDYEDAAKAVSKIKIKIVIPIHYGSVIGVKEDAEEFKRLVKDAKVILM